MSSIDPFMVCKHKYRVWPGAMHEASSSVGSFVPSLHGNDVLITYRAQVLNPRMPSGFVPDTLRFRCDQAMSTGHTPMNFFSVSSAPLLFALNQCHASAQSSLLYTSCLSHPSMCLHMKISLDAGTSPC